MAIARKTVLVTGCSAGGVGPALVDVFRTKGYHVFATAPEPSKIPKPLHSAANVTVLTLDVTSTESIAAAANQVGKEAGKLDVLINNAGGGLPIPALDCPLEEAKKLFDLNFFGALDMLQAFGPLLINTRGCIVNHASIAGVMGFPFSSMYAASKAALVVGSEVWRLELAPLGVRTITIMAGGIDTNFLANLPNLPLLDTSQYHSIKDIVQTQRETVPYGVAPDVFAAQVLQKVEQGATGKVWLGGATLPARIALWLLPSSFIDRFVENYKPFSRKLAEEHKKKVG